MKLYLEEFALPSVNDKNLYKEIENNKIILSSDGEYRIINNNLYKYYIGKNKKDKTFPNYLEKYTLLASGGEFIRRKRSSQIPYEHIIKDIQLHKYKLHPKSQTIFIIEKCDNKIIDFYFESPHEARDPSLKEDITSLLSYLK